MSYARLERSGNGVALMESRSTEIPPGTFQEGLLGGPCRDPRLLHEKLGELIEGLSATVREASLVLPDAWLRIVFTDGGDLPRTGTDRDEVLKWKLKRLVPYRVEELRVRGSELTPYGATGSPRLMMAFALEGLLSQLEGVFEAEGIHLGQITNSALAGLDALSGVADDGLKALTLVGHHDYTMVVARGGEPVLHRYKSLQGSDGESELIRRDLRLTRTFLEQQLPDVPLAAVCLVAPREVEASWLAWLSEELEQPARPVAREHLPPLAGAESRPLGELVPLLGAALREVA